MTSQHRNTATSWITGKGNLAVGPGRPFQNTKRSHPSMLSMQKKPIRPSRPRCCPCSPELLRLISKIYFKNSKKKNLIKLSSKETSYPVKNWARDLNKHFYQRQYAGSDGKESVCNAGDLASIPGLGRSTGEGNGNPLQYSCLENSMDRGAWRATVHGVTKRWTLLNN